jgi:hypothetical protein
MSPKQPDPRTPRHSTHAVISAAGMIVLSFVALVLVPNTLLGYLTTRVVPTWRDLIVVAWWAVAFVGCCVVFGRLQHRKAA